MLLLFSIFPFLSLQESVAGGFEGLAKIVEGLKRQEARMKPEFGFSQLLLDKAAKGESFTR